MQNKANIQILTQILTLLPEFRKKCSKFEARWKQAREAAASEDFAGYQSVSMVGSNPEVLDHFPPQYIIGQPINEAGVPVVTVENELVTVRMSRVEVEYMYGNPTGLYNLSLPEKKLRNHLNFRA